MGAYISATPLYKKLGIKSDSTILVLNSPKEYVGFFSDFPANVIICESSETEQVEFIHIFAKTIKELKHHFTLAKSKLKKSGALWISWPKKASGVESELDKFIVMRYGLDSGLVDTKIASVDKEWSGCKFAYRLEDR